MASDIRAWKRQKSQRYSLALVFNCTRDNYETFLGKAKVKSIVDVRQLGVPLKAGSSPADLSPSTCSMFIVMAEKSGVLEPQVPWPCNPFTSKQSVQYGLMRGSITLVTENARFDAFDPWPAERIGSLDELSLLQNIRYDVAFALTTAAQALDKAVKNHIAMRISKSSDHSSQASQGKRKGQGQEKCPGNKDYEREHNCSSETLRNIQRIWLRWRCLPETAGS